MPFSDRLAERFEAKIASLPTEFDPDTVPLREQLRWVPLILDIGLCALALRFLLRKEIEAFLYPCPKWNCSRKRRHSGPCLPLPELPPEEWAESMRSRAHNLRELITPLATSTAVARLS